MMMMMMMMILCTDNVIWYRVWLGCTQQHCVQTASLQCCSIILAQIYAVAVIANAVTQVEVSYK